jgi:hypothetical protein
VLVEMEWMCLCSDTRGLAQVHRHDLCVVNTCLVDIRLHDRMSVVQELDVSC